MAKASRETLVAGAVCAILALGTVAGCAAIAGLKNRSLEQEQEGADAAPPGEAGADALARDASHDTTVFPDAAADTSVADTGVVDSGPPQWTAVKLGLGNDLLSVQGSGPDDVWVVGNGAVLRWNGSAWGLVALLNPDAGPVKWSATWPIGSKTGGWIVGGDVGGYYQPVEGGYAFTPVPFADGAPTAPLTAVWASPGGPNGVAATPTHPVYAATAAGLLVDEGDAGWQTATTGDTFDFVDVEGPGPVDEVWAAGNYLYSPGSGDFVLAPSVSPSGVYAFNGVWGVDGGTAFAVGNGFAGYASSNNPVQFDTNFVDGGAVLNAVWAGAYTNAWAVGEYGLILHWDGNSWTLVTSPTTETLNGVWGSTTTSDVWAVGDHGTILHYP
jgi:hypothetical protein